MNKKRGIPCIVLGIVISVLGVFPIVWGIIIDNSDYLYNYQLDNYYSTGTFVNVPKILLIVGAVTIFIGLMLMILGIILYSTSSGRTQSPANYNQNNPAPTANEPAKQCAIIDEANCLTEYQKIGLLSRLGDFKSKTNYGIAIYIKRDDFNEELFKSAYDFYKTKALGQSCVILMISAANCKMFISTMGNCRKLMNDAGKERIYNTLRNYIFSGQYYDACIEFIDSALDCMTVGNRVNTAAQFIAPAAAQPVSVNESDQPQDIENVNPYTAEETQTDEIPVQPAEPINPGSFIPSQPENITVEPQTDVQANPYESSKPVNAEPQRPIQNNFCTACGAAINKDDKFCVQCGNKLI